MKIVLASQNKKKLAEMRALMSEFCGDKAEVLSPSDIGYSDEPEENGSTFEENALIKARALAALGYYAAADDSGLCVDALNGQPGIYSARWSGGNDSDNNKKLLAELDGVAEEKRGAAFVSCAVFVSPDGDEIISRGECRGKILFEARGEGGFGYDPLFWYEPFEKSFAELTSEEKNAISHRGIAVRSLAEKIADYIKAKNL